MTDLEMTKLCAAAMGHTLWCYSGHWNEEYASTQHMPIRLCGMPDEDYDPIHNDVQAMALVKKFGVTIDPQEDKPPFTWRAVVALNGDWDKQIGAEGPDLNRVIVECVAKVHAASTRSAKP